MKKICFVQASEISTEIKQQVDITPKEAGVSEVASEMVMASGKQTETHATTTLAEGLQGK